MYNAMRKRKSFHKFKDTLPLSEKEVQKLIQFLKELKPLEEEIKTKIVLVPASQVSSSVGAEYYVLFYSEKKGNYLRNIGYMGEQLDLFAVSQDIGTLWYGFGKAKESQMEQLDFVIMMGLSKVPKELFRSKKEEFGRKDLKRIWEGENIAIGELVRLAPSAVNSQPWFVKAERKSITVYRGKARLGVVPVPKLKFYNCIDMGIFLYFLDLCLEKEGLSIKKEFYPEESEVGNRILKVAKYDIES